MERTILALAAWVLVSACSSARTGDAGDTAGPTDASVATDSAGGGDPTDAVTADGAARADIDGPLDAVAADATTTETSDPTDGDAGGGLPPCQVEDPEPFASCELPSPCDTATFVRGSATTGGDDFWVDEAAADCVIAGLRDRTRGAYEVVDKDPAGIFVTRQTVWVPGGDVAMGYEVRVWDSPAGSTWWPRAQLRPAADLAACLTATPAQKKLDCLRDWSAGCADTAFECGPISPRP